ncbi:hypothetical protein [Flavobacterium sp.]|jgi:hypothetical protein|uniref:hypothetical protein n=1 Tax=Flavobacterium sp. TaxID=239 RepID=UPI0037C06B9E
MSNFILAGLFTEGTTDVRFLSSVVERTLEEVAFDCTGDIETKLEIINISKAGLSFNEQVLEASKFALDKFGVLILFVHTDSDSVSDDLIFQSKIVPAQKTLSEQDNNYCKNMVAIVPVQMTESWMIADKKLLKEEIGVEKTDTELGIHLNPESITNPKELIEEIIRISKEDLSKRRRNKGLVISDLYQIIGQKLEFSELEKLSSYLKFKNSLKDKLRELNFYHK